MDRSRAIFSCALRRIKKESHLNQSEKDIPEKEGKITTASAAALMPHCQGRRYLRFAAH
jgi:hypothetical protein